MIFPQGCRPAAPLGERSPPVPLRDDREHALDPAQLAEAALPRRFQAGEEDRGEGGLVGRDAVRAG